jgi:N-acyl homoserine lactone hydrolase
MPGLRLTVVDAGPLRPDKNKLVAFAAAEAVVVPTTVGIIEHPRHGLILWDTGINDVVADPERGEAYWGPGESATRSVPTPSCPSMLSMHS